MDVAKKRRWNADQPDQGYDGDPSGRQGDGETGRHGEERLPKTGILL